MLQQPIVLYLDKTPSGEIFEVVLRDPVVKISYKQGAKEYTMIESKSKDQLVMQYREPDRFARYIFSEKYIRFDYESKRSKRYADNTASYCCGMFLEPLQDEDDYNVYENDYYHLLISEYDTLHVIELFDGPVYSAKDCFYHLTYFWLENYSGTGTQFDDIVAIFDKDIQDSQVKTRLYSCPSEDARNVLEALNYPHFI
jgi:hypothetical protein